MLPSVEKNRKFTDEVTFIQSHIPTPVFFNLVSFICLLIGRSSIIFKVIYQITVRSVSGTLSLTNNYVRHLSVLWTTAVQRDGLTVALGVHVVVEHTRTTPVNEETTSSRLLKTR